MGLSTGAKVGGVSRKGPRVGGGGAGGESTANRNAGQWGSACISAE